MELGQGHGHLRVRRHVRRAIGMETATKSHVIVQTESSATRISK